MAVVAAHARDTEPNPSVRYAQVEDILSGIRNAMLDMPPEVPLADYVPKGAELIRAKTEVNQGP